MKQALWSLVFLVCGAFLLLPQGVLAASSDDATGNYGRRDPEDYNFLPLVLDPGKSTGDTNALRDIISYNMVYDQGYEVQCARPAWEITPQAYGAIEEYLEYHGAITLRGNASYNVDFSSGVIPLFRGDEELSQTQKNSSFEGYFGANYLGDTPPELNSSGVANVLLNQNGQCLVKYANLRSLFGDGGICSRLNDSGQCALNREIPNSNLTTEELYNALFNIFSKSNGERTLNCSDIVSGWSPELLSEGFDITEQRFESEITPVVNALKTAPLNLDVLYRLAFLIISPQQNPSGNGGVFDFLQSVAPAPASGGSTNAERHAPIVVGFKVPIIATNSIFSLPELRDTGLLSAFSLKRIEALERNQKEILTARESFIGDIIQNKETKPVINCDGMAQCTGSGDSQQLVQALIDIVNGSGETCGNFKGPYENAGDLGSPAAASAEKEFQSPYFSTVLPAENSAGFSWSLLISNENVNTEARQDGIPVTAHLITPYGSNMNYIAETLQSFFGADDESTETLEGFAKMVEENCIEDFNGECGLIPEYFTLGGITADLDSDSVTQTFIADRNPDCFDLSNPELIEQCQRESIGATTTEQPREVIRILGARLGWMIRKLQETFRGYGSKAYEYIKECKRTEDLFLGRCLGYQGLPGGSDQQVANSCNDYANTEVKLPASLTELGNVICKVANNNAKDVQLLWGITQIEGHTMNDLIGKESSVPCADLIDSERCGASMITGLIVPQCINPDAACSVGWATAEGTAAEKYRQELTNEVVCSVEGQLAYILKTRKSQIGELQALWRSVHGSNPSTDQLYYMMAGKNLGLENQYLTQPACGNAPGIDPAGIGCSEDNYCVCAMDRFTYQCGQTV